MRRLNRPLGIPLPGVVTMSEANTHDHHFARASRASSHREITTLVLRTRLKVRPRFPVVVTMTRVSKALCDSDNLAGCFKHVRDAIADLLGVNDADHTNKLVMWRVEQIKGPRPQTWVDIRQVPELTYMRLLAMRLEIEEAILEAGEILCR